MEMLPPTQAEKVLVYILEHVDQDCIFSRSYNKIQEDTGVSQPTIARVFKLMENLGAAKHISKSRWDLGAIIAGYSDSCEGFDIFVENKGP